MIIPLAVFRRLDTRIILSERTSADACGIEVQTKGERKLAIKNPCPSVHNACVEDCSEQGLFAFGADDRT